ncbi:MAG: NUDIX domain-containing protein [Candidatus Cloacimonadales bacterium]
MTISPKSYQGVNFCLRCGGKMKAQSDGEDKLRMRCTKCNWTFYKNPIPAAACLILNEENELLVIKRKFAPNPGEWALPSGYIEIDQSPEEAAIAEMEEETGLLGEIKQFIDYRPNPSPIYEMVISFGFWMKIVGGELKAGDDAEEARFVSLDNLPEICFASHRYYIDKIKKELAK